MPQTRLPERPKPPTGEEMLTDIAGADDNDVVFDLGQIVELTDFTPFSPDGGQDAIDSNGTEIKAAAEKRQASQRAYQKAVEFLQHIKALQSAPSTLQENFQQLDELSKEISLSIDKLKKSYQQLSQSVKKCSKK